MKKIRLLSLLCLLLLFLPGVVSAASYSFRVPQETVDVFWNADGTLSIGYVWVFANDPSAAPIDFIDVGLPSPNYNLGAIEADVDGKPITNIESSPYVKYGVALGLEGNAIPPGGKGTVRAFFPVVQAQLHPDDQQEGYVSAVFSPSYFGSEFARGQTDLKVIFHLPPGVQNEEPRWHSAPAGFPEQPQSALDDQERIVYIWENLNASPSREYVFGASFPAKYVTAEAIVQPGAAPVAPSQPSGSEPYTPGGSVFGLLGSCFSLLPTLLCFGLIALFVWAGTVSGKQRKLQYLPPSVSVEGHGIKRGLTAIEAAVLLEQPVDKILTMILFSVIKKNAARVKSRDPLELEIIVPQPPDLREYEKDFLQAFALAGKRERREALQNTMVNLVKDVAAKMKGFSRKETVAYYKDIAERAWKQVEAADTPEVKSEKYEEVMDWTMLDKDYDDRTRRVFGPGPVFVPVWWHNYDPSYPRPAAPTAAPVTGAPVSPPMPTTGAGGKTSLPTLPGADFAASMVRGVQSFSAGVVGDLTAFTSGITNKTNPVPVSAAANKSTWSKGSGGGGGSFHCACACACACAGCACACAGGGR